MAFISIALAYVGGEDELFLAGVDVEKNAPGGWGVASPSVHPHSQEVAVTAVHVTELDLHLHTDVRPDIQ